MRVSTLISVLFCIVVLASCAMAPHEELREVVSPDPQIVEYDVMIFSMDYGPAAFLEMLKDYGGKGWRLAHFFPYANDYTVNLFMVWEREQTDAKPTEEERSQ